MNTQCNTWIIKNQRYVMRWWFGKVYLTKEKILLSREVCVDGLGYVSDYTGTYWFSSEGKWLYRVFFLTGTPPKSSEYKKVNLG